MNLLLLALILASPARSSESCCDEVMGAVSTHTILRGESLIELGRQYNVGYNAITEANPDLDAFVPKAGAEAVLPTAWILPRASAPGTIVVNLSEMRLYYFPLSGSTPMTFPVGVGSEGWDTPLGAFSVVAKQVAPTWYPPASIRREDPELPASVPPGPDNPLGTHALRLSRGSILIHGTNRPFGVGMKMTHGCMRLYPEDIPHLFQVVKVGTPVQIVREPVKVGLKRGRVYVEVHRDPDIPYDPGAEARRLLTSRGLLERTDARKLNNAVWEQRGIPVDVTGDEKADLVAGHAETLAVPRAQGRIPIDRDEQLVP